MRKTLILLLAGILLILSFGCNTNEQKESTTNSNKKYTAMQCALFDQVEPFGYSSTEIYQFCDEEKYAASEPQKDQEIVFDFLGHKTTAFYEGINRISHENSYYEYFYLYTSNDNNSKYYFDNEGTLTGYFGFNSQIGEKILSEEECLNIAVSFIASTFSKSPLKGMVKLSQCKLETTKSDDSYTFNFQKYCGSYKTTEYANVTVMLDGTVRSYKSSMMNAVDWEENYINIDSVKSAVEKVINEEIYAKTIQQYKTDLIFEEFVLTTLENGAPGIIVFVKFNVYYGEKDLPDHTTKQQLIVFESE